MSAAPFWDERFARPGFLFGEAPNAFLKSQAHLLKPGMSVLAVADGEGRNGVWLAEQGLQVHAVDASAVALEKSRQFAARRGVSLQWEEVDLQAWAWPHAVYDAVVAIFTQFVGPEGRARQFAGMRQALKPGGLLILQGYTPRQLEYGTGGPPHAENMYTQELLREAFGDWDILHLAEHDDVIEEGSGHSGMSALIDLVARKPG
ncbi:class I SAM-dependent methyltransferase [Betaproteobacteria bacterium SCN2]|nr:class I SAM-dependent methyltransferase [Betaproteobacteria bacterium SCN2]